MAILLQGLYALIWAVYFNKTGCTSAIEVNFIAFGLHCLGVVRERKSGIGMLLYNSYTAYIHKLFV